MWEVPIVPSCHNRILCTAFVTLVFLALSGFAADPPRANQPAPAVAAPQPPGDDYQAAVAQAVRLFAEHGELEHLRAILEKHPKLVNSIDPLIGRKKPLGDES